jgi:GntR family transcriptional regulator
MKDSNNSGRSGQALEMEATAMKHASARDRARDLILQLVAAVEPGTRLPTYDELADRANCSVGPIKEAMKSLERAGIVSLQRGRRARALGRDRLKRLPSLSRTVQNHGGELVNRVLEAAHRVAQPQEYDCWRLLELDPQEPVLVCRRLRIVDGQPLVIHNAYIRPEIVGGPSFFEAHDVARESLTAIYEAIGIKALRVRALLRAALADEEERSLLKLPEGAPVLRNLQQALVKRDQWQGPLEVVRASYIEECSFEFDRHLID